jgi:hypothetical protein
MNHQPGGFSIGKETITIQINPDGFWDGQDFSEFSDDELLQMFSRYVAMVEENAQAAYPDAELGITHLQESI